MEGSLYPTIKALHIIFMVTFFAGTFYIVRLFIYHQEATRKWEPDRTILMNQFALMERRLWYFITWPSVILMTLFGLWLLVLNPALLKQPWMHAKLGLIALLLAYHGITHRLFLRIQRNLLQWSSFRLRLWNEGPTLVLFAVVFLVSIKQLQWYYGAIGLLVLGGVIALGILQYRRKRQRTDAESGGPRA
jgi:protoporphyrinogen IX oxidase